MANPNYETLTGAERFALMIEAMARGDEAECDRLEDSCPQKVYRCDDADFRDCMRRAYHIAATVVLNMREGLVRIRMAKAFRDTAHLFAGEIAKFATAAYLCGRVNGRAEVGLASAGPHDSDAVAKELAASGGFDQQKAEIIEVAEDVLQRLADTLYEAVAESDAPDVLAQWEGFGRFCREALGTEPLTVVRAYGLQREDPAAEVRGAYPDAAIEEAEKARWAAARAQSWNERFSSGGAG
jgi:hypothetical protein